jgi:hypothetical protein
MRVKISIEASTAAREQLAAVVADCNSPGIIVARGGTGEIMRRAGVPNHEANAATGAGFQQLSAMIRARSLIQGYHQFPSGFRSIGPRQNHTFRSVDPTAARAHLVDYLD